MKHIKSNNGNTGVDIVISVGIIAITLTVVASLYFSLYISNTEIERKAQALSYATQILEKVSEYYYADITQENFEKTTLPNGAKQVAGIQLPRGYDVSVLIDDNEGISDVVKTVEVTINYTIFKKEKNVKLSTYKAKERLLLPNKPELAEGLVPVKVQNNSNSTSYIVTSTADTSWYNYTAKQWALAVESIKAASQITIEDLYVWVPRYAYYLDGQNNIKICFLYADKNQSVNSSGNLYDIDTSLYTTVSKFSDEDAKGYWIKIVQINNDQTAKRLNDSEYGRLIY